MRESTTTHVVLDTKWLSYHIIGPTFAGKEFGNQFTLLPSEPSYTGEALAAFYEHIADFETLKNLLLSLELAVQLDDGTFTIPAKLSPSDKKAASQLKHGRCVTCEETSMFAPILFPALQARVFVKLRSEGSVRWFAGKCLTSCTDTLKLYKQKYRCFEKKSLFEFMFIKIMAIM